VLRVKLSPAATHTPDRDGPYTGHLEYCPIGFAAVPFYNTEAKRVKKKGARPTLSLAIRNP
jgi:hypothetical protein